MPKIRLNFKRGLLGMNRLLDHIVGKISEESQYWFLYGRSHHPGLRELTHVQRATLFLEDRRFNSHYGVEFRMIFRLARLFVTGRRLGGISTIDQQVVRIVRDRYERTASRKLSELLLAVLINAHLTKKEILHYYLHFAYMGYKLQGVEVASKVLFAKNAVALNEDQGCFVAALFARPAPRSVVFAAVSSNGTLTPHQLFEVAKKSGDELWSTRCRLRYEYALRNYVRIPNNLSIK